MTFSEFGRRVQENANCSPTTAPPRRVRARRKSKTGIIRQTSSLSDSIAATSNSTDFRSVYGTVLEHWLSTKQVVLGRKFSTLSMV